MSTGWQQKWPVTCGREVLADGSQWLALDFLQMSSLLLGTDVVKAFTRINHPWSLKETINNNT